VKGHGPSETLIARSIAAAVIVSWFGFGGSASAAPALADTLANGVPRVLLPALSSWIKVWRHAAPGFSADSLKRSSSGPFEFGSRWAGAGPKTIGVRSGAGVDVLSPDSSHSLDFDWYVEFERDPDGTIVPGREADSSPILADFARDSVLQVTFCGTTCFYDGAYWVDAHRFALTGAARTGAQADGPWAAFLEIYDLTSQRCARWRARPADDTAFGRYQAASDSSLARRLERAGFGKGFNPNADSRLNLANERSR
jgi:hypothetical protein